MNLYELAYLISADASETEAKAIENQLTLFIQEKGGVILTQAPFLRKNLAYPVKKQTEAYLADVTFRILAEKVAALDKKMKSENHVLRHLLLAQKEMKFTPEKKKRKPFFEKSENVSPVKEKKVELKDIDRKLEEILESNEPR